MKSAQKLALRIGALLSVHGFHLLYKGEEFISENRRPKTVAIAGSWTLTLRRFPICLRSVEQVAGLLFIQYLDWQRSSNFENSSAA